MPARAVHPQVLSANVPGQQTVQPEGNTTMDDAAQMAGEPLAGAHVLLTGATGFVGQAILEKLLATYPETRVSLVVRPRGSRSARQRLDALLDKPVFDAFRSRVGEEKLAAEVERRVSVIESGTDEQSDLPDDLDAVVHAASNVAFDPPVEEAFEANVGATQRLYEALARSGSDAHVVHVSTAYVAGLAKGLVPETALAHEVDWRRESAAAARGRDEVEQQSRSPEILRELMSKARSRHRKAGPQAVATAAEKERATWVHERLVDVGRTRAKSLGWPDVYTFTKALGERVAEHLWAGSGHRLTILRPSIIESALRDPYPGWIDGFKVADPLIVAYGQGHVRQFPGLADCVMDVIPVDIVANAALAAAAAPPPAADPAYLQVTSGARNPLPFHRLYELVRDYFLAYPMPDGNGGSVTVPSWRFEGAGPVRRRLGRQRRIVGLAETALAHLPSSPRTRDLLATAQKRRSGLERLSSFADLYQSYTHNEAVYDDARTLTLHRRLAPGRVATHGFDAAEIDWAHYLQEVHLPSVTAQVRTLQQRRPATGTSSETGPLPQRTDVLAVFDLQGTVLDTNAVEQYLWTQMLRLPRTQWPRELADLARCLPAYVAADRRDRGEFIRTFVQRYRGMEAARVERLIDELLAPTLYRRVMPDALRRIQEHRAAGHRTVLVTGTIECFVRPLAAQFDDVQAARLHTENGRWTGHLDAPPLVDEARAAWLRRYAESACLDLAGSYAYGDSHSDCAWMDLVGNPQAVNPDIALFQHARSKHWPVHTWRHPEAGRLTTALDSLRLQR